MSQNAVNSGISIGHFTEQEGPKALRPEPHSISSGNSAFEPNYGQAHQKVQFLARSPGGTLYLTPNEFVLALNGGPISQKPSHAATPAPAASSRSPVRAAPTLRFRLVLAEEQPEIVPIGKSSARVNHIRAEDSFATEVSVPTYRKVSYRAVYPGIDMVFHRENGQLEYDFIVSPKSDPRDILLEFPESKLRLDRKGRLIISIGSKEVRQQQPTMYQILGGRRIEIDGGYRLVGRNRVGLWVGDFDKEKPLIIDPILPLSKRIAGNRDDSAADVATDNTGNTYVAGWSGSIDFARKGAVQPEYGGGECAYFTQVPCGDAFVAKFDPRGNLVYSTFFGGPGTDSAAAVSVDRTGNVYLAGRTNSDGLPGSDGSMRGGDGDAFVAKFSPDGSKVLYSQYFGGGAEDSAEGIDVDGEGRAHITGFTSSDDFPTLNAFQPVSGGGACIADAPPFAVGGEPCTDAFVVTLDPSGTPFQSTYLGGSGHDSGADIVVDESGNSYVTGQTESEAFPTAGSAQAKLGGGRCPIAGQSDAETFETEPCTDAFVAKLSLTGFLTYSTYLGGKGEDSGNGIAVDSSGSAVIAGTTNSPNFPTARPLQRKLGGGVCLVPGRDAEGPTEPCSDAFLSKLDPVGSRLSYSTYLGGKADDEGEDLDVDVSGNAFLVGWASKGFRVKSAVQPVWAGHADAFVTQLNPRRSGGSSMVWSTYLGGSGRDRANAVSVDSSKAAHIAGHTDSRSDFPIAEIGRSIGGGQLDSFVARLAPSTQGLPQITGVRPRSGPVQGGNEVVITGSGFLGATHVSFGNAEATKFDVSKDGQRLTAKVPKHKSGLVTVTVRTKIGASGPVPGAKYTFAGGGWTSTSGPVLSGHTATLMPDGRILVAGGCTRTTDDGFCSEEPSRRVRIFDPVSGQWSSTASMKIARLGHTATLLPAGPPSLCGDLCGNLVVVGPLRSGCAESYDLETAEWRRIPSPRGPAITPDLCTKLETGQSIPFGGNTATLLGTRPGVSCGERCGNVLFVGVGPGGPPEELFDPQTNSWIAAGQAGALHPLRSRPSLDLIQRQFHTSTLLPNGQVLLVGGTSDGIPPEDSVVYDPVGDKFSSAPAPSVRRYGGHSANLLSDGRVLVAGGVTDNIGTLTSSAELYDPTGSDPSRPGGKGTWKPTGSLTEGRFGHAAASLSNGNLLIVGGSDVTGDPNARRQNLGSSPVATEVFDPESGRWKAHGEISEGRSALIVISGAATYLSRNFTLTPLSDGRIVLIGGGKAPEIYGSRSGNGGEGPFYGGSLLIFAVLLFAAVLGFVTFLFRRRRRLREPN